MDEPAVEELPRRREWRLAGVIFFSLLTLGILYATLMILWPFLTAIIVGAILVTLTYGLFKRVRARLGGRPGRAAIVMLIGITFVLIIPAVILVAMLVQQANTLIQRFQSGEAQQFVQRLDIAHRLAFVQRWVPSFDPEAVSAQRLVLPLLRQAPAWMTTHGAAVVGGLAGLVIAFFLILLSAYFFYVEGEAILIELTFLSPLPSRYDQEFATKFKDVVDATFRGQVMTSLAQGIATGIGLAIAGVPGAIFWGAVATILSLLPMLGAAVVWAPAAIYLFIAHSMGQGGLFGPIFLTIWGFVVVSTIDNIVRPWAMKGKAQLPAIPLLFAVLGGLQAFGFVGLVIGPLVFSLLMSIIDIYKRSFRIPPSKSDVA